MKKIALYLLFSVCSIACAYDGGAIWSGDDTSSEDEPAPSPSAQAIQKIRQGLKLHHLNFTFDNSEIEKQRLQYPSKVSFSEAAVLALKSFMSDASDEESLLLLLIEDVGESASAQVMRNMMDKSKVTLRLITTDSELSPNRHEDLSHYWIFSLNAGKGIFSDHTFWAAVHRQGLEPTRNYGFN